MNGFAEAEFLKLRNIGQNPKVSGLFLAVCVALVIIGLIEPLAGLFNRVSIDYGEGFNAYWAAAAMNGPGALYSPAHIMVADNYPPLSFYLIGTLGRIIGDNIFAGRIVALAAMIATAGLSGWAATLLGASLRWGWITGLLLLACAEHLFGHFVALDNPQWLAQAIMLGGTIPLIRRPDGPTPRDCLISAVAIVVAVLVKHNLFAFPLANAWWLAKYYRGAFIRWSLAIAGLATLAGVALYAIYGPAIYVEIMAFDRTVDWRNFRDGLVKSDCFIPMLLVTAAVAGAARRDVRWTLFAAAGLLGLVLGIVQRLGAGVYTNAHFEALVALVIVTGHAFGTSGLTWRMPFGAARWQTALLAALLIPSLIPLPQHIRDWSEQLAARQAIQTEWTRTIADVRDAQFPVLCEIPAICYWSGKPFIVDFFAFGQKIRTSHQSFGLYNWISTRKFMIVILDKSYLTTGRQPRLPAPFPGLIDREYRTIRVIPKDDIDEMVARVPPPRLAT